jgi:hypothetical protein
MHTFRGSHLHTIIQKNFTISNIYPFDLNCFGINHQKGEIVSAINPSEGFGDLMTKQIRVLTVFVPSV